MTAPIRAYHIGTITIQGTDADIKRMLREFWGVIGFDANAQT